MNVLEIFLLVICGRVLRPISSTGARHGRDPVSVGLRFLCAAVRGGEEECLLRVHQTTHRPLQDHGLWQVRRDLCELPHECRLFLFIWGHPAFAIITSELWFLALMYSKRMREQSIFLQFHGCIWYCLMAEMAYWRVRTSCSSPTLTQIQDMSLFIPTGEGNVIVNNCF